MRPHGAVAPSPSRLVVQQRVEAYGLGELKSLWLSLGRSADDFPSFDEMIDEGATAGYFVPPGKNQQFLAPWILQSLPVTSEELEHRPAPKGGVVLEDFWKSQRTL